MLPLTRLDHEVRNAIYHHFLEQEMAPNPHDTAAFLGASVEDVEESYQRLADAHVLVLEPGGLQIRMALPFSAVPTRYRTSARGHTWFANCAWDALGIAAMLGTETKINTTCPDCNRPIDLAAHCGDLSGGPGVIHFAIPAAHWWDDIVYT